jgi:hypothetical protein
MPKMKAQARALIARRMGHFGNAPSWGFTYTCKVKYPWVPPPGPPGGP